MKATGSNVVDKQDVEVSECISIQAIDTSAPAITCPSNIIANNDLGACAATVDVGSATAVDNCSNGLNPQASTTGPFPLDTTPVTFSVTDASGNSAACDISVVVTDNEAPVLTCPSDLTSNTGAGVWTATIVIPIAAVTDNCGLSLTPSTTAALPLSTPSQTPQGIPTPVTLPLSFKTRKRLPPLVSQPTTPAAKFSAANNQDGFFTLGGSDNCSVASYHVVDSVSGFVFGPFPFGTVFRYVHAPGGKPTQKPGTGKVNYFLQGKGDAYVHVTDGCENTAKASCLVPPKHTRLLRAN